MIVSNSMQTVDRLPALFIRAITLVLTLIVGVTSTAIAQTSLNNGVSPIESGDISERFEFADELQFAPCPEDPTLECGTLTVPVDYRKPQGEKVGIAVIRPKRQTPRAGRRPRGQLRSVLPVPSFRLRRPLPQRFDLRCLRCDPVQRLQHTPVSPGVSPCG